MKKNEVKVGGTYTAKVSDRLVSVRIDSAHGKQGWNATNTATGKRIHIKSAQRLRGHAKPAAVAKAADAKPAVVAKAAGAKPGANKDAQSQSKPKRLSALDAAAQVLRKAAKPMTSKALIGAMAEQKLRTSPKGKTPHATLNAAMLREIGSKAGKARFKKVGRGLFAFNAGGK